MVNQQLKDGRLGSDEPTALAPLRGQAPSGLEQSRSSTDAALLALARRCEAGVPGEEAVLLLDAFALAMGDPSDANNPNENFWSAYRQFAGCMTARAFIDAAMMLMPCRAPWGVSSGELFLPGEPIKRGDVAFVRQHRVRAATAALALAAAALRARATEQDPCPGHVASDADPKVCRNCGTHVDEERPASVDTRPQGGDANAAPFTSGAVPERQTPNTSQGPNP